MGQGKLPYHSSIGGERSPIMPGLIVRACAFVKWRAARYGHLTCLLASIVTVAEYQGPAAPRVQGAVRGRRIDSATAMIVGHKSGAELLQVVGGLFVDSSVLVSEASSGTVRSFRRRDGTEEKAIGRRGQGPGEFVQLAWMQRLGPDLYVSDAALNRLSRFSLRGEYRGTITIPRSEGFASSMALGVFGDGAILIAGVPRRERVAAGKLIQSRVLLMRLDSLGRFADSLGWLAGTETFVEPFGRAGEMVTKLVFGREVGIAVGGQRYAVVANEDYGLIGYDEAGRELGRTIPTEQRLRTPVTPADIRAARQRFVSKALGGIDLGGVFDRMPIPDSFPPYGWAGEHSMPMLQATSSGELWVLHFGGVRESRQKWSVFRADGTFLYDVVGPGGMRVLDVADGMALVLTWDADGTEQVELRRVLP